MHTPQSSTAASPPQSPKQSSTVVDGENYFSKKGERFSQELFEFIPNELKKKIVDLASSDIVITTAAKYMGVFPILTRIYLYHNVPINSS